MPDLTNFEQLKETKHYIVYVQKNPIISNQRELIVFYKLKGVYARALLTDKLFQLFFSPEDYVKVYKQEPKQRGN